ncbi:hypothetical protein HYU14_01645 [Candidatus Woesearchaeota archaeon]|nr:hypothetical protein [Candidatus Woesearchaeota archaeon]
MALSNKKISGLITEIGGNEALSIIDYIKDKKNVSEFIIADKLKLDMQTTRNLLYNLNSFNVCTYIRKKDRKKGWYISYWTFDRKRASDLVSKVREEKLNKLREQLKKEEANKGNFYICKSACARFDFEQATEFAFKCPECGSLLNMQDNTKTIENIKNRIEELGKEGK